MRWSSVRLSCVVLFCGFGFVCCVVGVLVVAVLFVFGVLLLCLWFGFVSCWVWCCFCFLVVVVSVSSSVLSFIIISSNVGPEGPLSVRM